MMADLIRRKAVLDELLDPRYTWEDYDEMEYALSHVPAVDAVEVPKDNADDMNLALHGLGIFRKSFCLNVKETDKQNEPVFRCTDCPFEDKSSRKCAVKMFLNKYSTEEERQKFLHIMW